MADTAAEEPEGESVEVHLRWQDAAQLPTLYANQVYITHAGPEFYVLFGEVEASALATASAGEVVELPVKPVAKLVFTAEGIGAIVDAMHENVQNYRERKAKQQ